MADKKAQEQELELEEDDIFEEFDSDGAARPGPRLRPPALSAASC